MVNPIFRCFFYLNMWKCYVTASDSSDGDNSKHCDWELCGRCTLLPATCCWLWYRRVCHIHIPNSLIHWSVSSLSVCHIPYYQPHVAGFDIDVSVTSLTHSYTGQLVLSLSVTSLTSYQPHVAGFDIGVSVTSLTHSYTGQLILSLSVTSLTINHMLPALILTCLSHPLVTHTPVSQLSLYLSHPLLPATCCRLWYRRVCHIP